MLLMRYPGECCEVIIENKHLINGICIVRRGSALHEHKTVWDWTHSYPISTVNGARDKIPVEEEAHTVCRQ